MPENPPEKAYKHQVPADVFVEAFTTLEWTAAQTKKFNKLGIERLGAIELREKNIELGGWYISENEKFTMLAEAEVVLNSNNKIIRIINIANILPPLVIKKCLFPSIEISFSQLAEINTQEKLVERGTNFFVLESNIGDLYLFNSSFNNITIKSSNIGGIDYYNESFAGDLKISESTVKYISIEASVIGTIDILNCITGDIIFSHKSLIRGVEIKHKSFVGELATHECNCEYIKVEGGIVGNVLTNDSTVKYISITDSLTGSCEFVDSTIDTLHAIKIFTSFTFEKLIINQIYLFECEIATLRIGREFTADLQVINCLINLLYLEKIILNKNSIISFTNTSFFACDINNFSVLGNLFFREVSVNRHINNIFKEELLKEYNDEINDFTLKKFEVFVQEQLDDYLSEEEELLAEFPNPTFRISQSSLGKTEFTDCDLAGFNFEYNNSKITEVFISGGTVPENVVVYDEQDKLTKVEKLHQQKSFFDQLKKVFEGQGDIVRGTIYHARTSGIQMQIIEAEKRKWWFKYFDTEWWVYKLNETSNRHGESWGWAIVFTLGLSAIGFIFYNAALVNPKYELVWHTDFLGDWAQFILPTHKTDFMVNNPSSGAVFIDVISRIFIGYGIYQLISAFRKHGKRG